MQLLPCWLLWNTTIGVATSAYQTEGAWNVSGKLESVWDRFAHESGHIIDGTNGDTACQSYDRYEEDVKMAADLGARYFRFSISWPRVLFRNQTVNEEGVRHYRDVLETVHRYNLTPFVTLFHWDTPQWIEEELGGWGDPHARIVPAFAHYARTVMDELGDLVSHWITLNEPYTVATQGYGDGSHAPGVHSRTTPYTVLRNMVLAHQEVYVSARDRRPGTQVGISINMEWIEAATPKDEEVAERARIWRAGILLDPLFLGQYPEEVLPFIRLLVVGGNSTTAHEGRRLVDFLGINHYTTLLAHRQSEPAAETGFSVDSGAVFSTHGHWPGSAAPWLHTVPFGLDNTLGWLRTRYFPFDVDIYITENGYASPPGTDDADRIQYLGSYMCSLLQAVYRWPSLRVKGYFVWSLLDNFEWAAGFTQRFGLVEVDFDDEGRTRRPRESARWVRRVSDSMHPLTN